MSTERWSLEDLQWALAQEAQVWVRAAAASNPQAGDDWQVHFMEVTAGTPPPSWKEASWEYDRAVLYGACESGEVVAEWVKTARVPFGSRSVEWKVQAPFQVDRHASKAHSGGYEPLRWPCIEMTIAWSAPSNGPSTILVADDAPTFFDLGSAAAALFGLEVQLGRMAQSWQSSFRRQDLSGRICRIKITPTQLIVDVDGTALADSTLDLSSITSHQPARLTVDGAQTVTFDLSGGLPQGSLVVLHRGREWIDIRYLNYPYAISKQDDVEVEVEPATRLDAIVTAGEGPTTEFKETPPPTDPDGIRRSLKTVAAFANGEGGTLMYGVNNDGIVVGIKKTAGTEERLAGLVRSWISPLPEFSIETLPVETDPEAVVYAIVVNAGSTTPYGCGTTPTNIAYYFRRGSTTFAVWPQDLRESARSRPLTPAIGYPMIPLQ
jgi:hypothetical protein